MEITEVRIKLMEEPGERLKAFCSITFDNCFVVRDLKIIDGSNGPFVAMPSRKLTAHCPKCGMKNHLRAAYCNQCGGRQAESRAPKDADGRAKLYADIAHPINSSCREMIQNYVIEEYFEEIERAKLPGYVSRYDDFDFEYSDSSRGRPARFDQPHSSPVEQPHVATRAPAAKEGPAGKPHFRQDPPASHSEAAPRRRRRTTISERASFRKSRDRELELRAGMSSAPAVGRSELQAERKKFSYSNQQIEHLTNFPFNPNLQLAQRCVDRPTDIFCAVGVGPDLGMGGE